MKPLYDTIGTTYSVSRCTDPEVAEQLYAALAGATRVLNIGAGTGSYEPSHTPLIAVEPSWEMVAQRGACAHPVVQASAENIPLEANSVSHAMTVLSMHHWPDRPRAFAEINRVATQRFVAITWDPAADPFWLTRDYFPEIYAEDREIFPPLDELAEHFDNVETRALAIPAECQDGFLAAFWRRPDAYLSAEVRACMSSFAKRTDLDAGVQRLQRDLQSGAWFERNGTLLDAPRLDVGYRLVAADVR